MLQKPITYMYRVYTIYNYLHDCTIRDSNMQTCMACARNPIVDYNYYITLSLQGRHKHLASRSIHMDRIRIPPDTSPDTEVLGGRRTTITMMTLVKIDIYVFTLS